MECSICQRSVLNDHLVDGDFCPDCWEGDEGSSFLKWAWNTHTALMNDMLRAFRNFKERKQ